MIARILIAILLFSAFLPCQAQALKSAETLPDVGLNGIWMDPAGGIFTVRQEGNSFAWIGQGDKDGRYYLHRGVGTLDGRELTGEWLDLPDSQFYPSQGNISGTLSDDRQVIRWRDNSGFYREWVRQMASAASAFASAASGTTTAAGAAGGGGTMPQTLPVDSSSGDQATDATPAGDRGKSSTVGGWDTLVQALHADRPSGDQATETAPAGDGGKSSVAGGWGEMAEALQQSTAVPVEPEKQPEPAVRSLATMSNEEIGRFLEGPDAWKSAEIRAQIDAWLAQALPEFAAKDHTARYEKWGRITGRGITIAGDPEISEDRYHYLWRNAAKFPSLNLCTMKIYVERSIKGEPLTDCRTNISAAPEYNPPDQTLDEMMDAAVREAGIPASPAEPAFTPKKMTGPYLQALENIPPRDWINGKPDLDRIVVVICYDPSSKESLMRMAGAEQEFKKYLGWGYMDKQLTYVAIGQGDVKTLEPLIKQAGISFPTASDIIGQAAAAFGEHGCTSETFLVGSRGEIVQKLPFYPRDPARERYSPEERSKDSRIDAMLKNNRDLHNNIRREIFNKFPSRK